MPTRNPIYDRPWRRAGVVRYAAARVRAILRPPVRVSAAPPDLVVDRDVSVRMRDGVVLRVNVYRPPGSGPFPVILAAHPYGKDRLPKRRWWGWGINPQFRILRQPGQVEISSETSWEAPDPVWWLAHGYAVVNADIRGAGTSDGAGALMSDQEAEDVYDLIEWAGAAPWSSGSVGMAGVSYLAMAQFKAAALGPPSLKAICPWEGFTDAYRDMFNPGGVAEKGFSRVWQTGTKHVMRVTEDIGAQRRVHPLRDQWWQSLVPDLGRIEVPMLVCASFSDNNLHGRGSFRAFEKVGAEDKFAYTHRGGKWTTFYSPEARQAQLAFFDLYLKHLDVPKPPRVRLEVRERGDVIAETRAERQWPLENTDWRDLYLADDGVLDHEPPAAEGSVSFHTRRRAAAFTLPMVGDLELTGPMSLALWVSVEGADDVALFAGVEKWVGNKWVSFEGSYGYGRDRITTGWQRVSLRELDVEQSTPYEPVHTFAHSQPLSPGEVVPVELALGPSATAFRHGDRIRLVIAGRQLAPRNPLYGSFPALYAPSPPARCTLHWGADRPARLRVPVIGSGDNAPA
ncbi:CocE/NonD family hydrolase [Mycobacterium marinum]|uniref:CocE/NonD family hydrolase n=1 Tax=Mycobacterium marinum TaxID=1781 RepID=UPI000E3CC257|nr:CocE/NonD family hydrolase [Mycobacterium marinum]RFZ41869.1 Cocaine esterase [Mycobacterium marinum]GJO01458.1 hydrolase [Mycobacterium marinum]GJP11411.1 hydrolase [Mycobacterium marinum]GJP24652.1 hydrolase [Mycobacterium marinum]